MEKKLDLRVQKTYKALHNAFTELLEEKSFEEFTVCELCDRALIRKNTFYLHFGDKYEYFNFYLSELRQEFQIKISNKNDITNPSDYSLQMLHEMFQFVHAHKAIILRLKESNRLSFLYEALSEQISIELYNILVILNKNEPSTDIHLIIAFYSGGLMNTIYWWLNNPNELDETAIVTKLFELLPLPTKIV